MCFSCPCVYFISGADVSFIIRVSTVSSVSSLIFAFGLRTIRCPHTSMNTFCTSSGIQKSLPEKFTFEDFIKKGEEFQCSVNLKTHLGYGRYAPLYLRVMMGYTYGDFAGKRILFDQLVYKICDMQK